MDSSFRAAVDPRVNQFVPAGADRFGAYKILGISSVAVKVSTQDSRGEFFVVEITLVEKGGPARHLHYDQDEWFFITEGEFIIEAGNERYAMQPGDSLFVPRKTPHAWAFSGGPRGKMIASVNPAGRLEEFFENADKGKSLPGPDQTLWQPYGMEWVGPPIRFD